MESDKAFYFYALKVNEITGWPVVFLQDQEKKKTLSISMPKANALAIFIALQLKKCPAQIKPLSQDLFIQLAAFSNVKIQKITIDDFSPESTYVAKIFLLNKDKNSPFIINSSASDAIAIALRAKVSIWISSNVISKLPEIDPDAPPFCEIQEQYFFTP